MPLLALKIDVDTYRGTLRGRAAPARGAAPRNAGATFLFSLGPDHTGRAIRACFAPAS
jgi:undecaprenyl phosphate-alpha-L-ara4FN deformylase